MTGQPEQETSDTIREGQAIISVTGNGDVFYNPVQEFNRDLSIAVIKSFISIYKEEKKNPNKEIIILEALGATGLRSIRYAKEIPSVNKIICNDLDPVATENIMKNVEFNNVSNIVKPKCGDACQAMYRHSEVTGVNHGYDIIDIDPYGTASPFIDPAIQAVTNGGLLCITCTDAAVFNTTKNVQTCYSKYGGIGTGGVYGHEAGLRLVLNALNLSASRYGKYLEPLLCLSIDFYARLFVRVHHGNKSKTAGTNTSLVAYCNVCSAFEISPLISTIITEKENTKYSPIKNFPSDQCKHCHSRLHLAGPLWGASIKNNGFLEKFLSDIKGDEGAYGTYKRINGMVSVAFRELELPFYVNQSHMSGILHCNTPSAKEIKSAVLNAGYQVSGTHACPVSFKTDAPFNTIWDIMRSWVAKYPIKPQSETSPSTIILSKPAEIVADFTYNKTMPKFDEKIIRYQQNPTKNFGPMSKHKRKINAFSKQRSEPQCERSDKIETKIPKIDQIEDA